MQEGACQGRAVRRRSIWLQPARRRLSLFVSLFAIGGPAQAGTLETIRQAGVVHCGAAARPGFADIGENGRITGLGVDLCRAVTIAVLGPTGRSAFRIYASAHDYDAVRTGADEVAFLTADAVAEQDLAGSIIPGPVAFIAELTALAQPGADVKPSSTAVCILTGSRSHQALEAWADRTHALLARIGFQETTEMHDAFDAHRCGMMAGEASELAEFQAGSARRAGARILPAFGLLPVFAATSTADGVWAGLVGWALGAVIQSEAAPSSWRSDLPGTKISGLRGSWQADVSAALGSYGAMLDRNLGARSRLVVRPGPNAPWPDGMLLPPGPR